MTATATLPAPVPAGGVESLPPSGPALLLQQAARRGQSVAMRRKDLGIWHETTWDGYVSRVAVHARALAALGVQRGDRVAVLADNRPEWVVTDLATQALGAITVGLYSTSPAAEVEYLLAHSGAVVCVVEDEEQWDKVRSVRASLPALRRVVVLESRGVHALGHDPLLLSLDDFERLGTGATRDELVDRVAALDPSAVAILVYTSGTTGPPKGAMITNANLMAAAEALSSALQWEEGEELLSYLPLCHILERLLSTELALRAGATVNFGGGGESLGQDLREVQPHRFIGVPRVWEKMLATVEIRMGDASWLKRATYRTWLGVGRRIARKRLSRTPLTPVDRLLYAMGWVLLYRPLRQRLGLARVKLAGSGAAPIAPAVLEFFWAIGVPICEGYGMTENTAVGTFTRPDDVRIGKVGRTYPGSELRIADDGEILTRGPGTFAGYFRNEAATRETIDADGWLHTGDVGTLDADGFLQITDRKKDILITAGGKNISPSWIENALKVSPYVREAIVIGDRRKYLVALIGIEYDTVGNWATQQRIAFTTYADLSARPEVVALIDRWVQEVNAQLAQVEQVKRFALLPKELDHEEGELTATQKVKRRAIAAQFQGVIEAMYA
jgi:long-chain acyl-CoA synthetase